MRIFNEPILTAGDVSLTSLTSSAVNLDFYFLYAIQAVFTGAPVGTVKLQASLDYVPAGFPQITPAFSGNWTDVANSSTAISAAGTVIWNAEDVGYNWVRLVYTKTSGTGALSARINCKGA